MRNKAIMRHALTLVVVLFSVSLSGRAQSTPPEAARMFLAAFNANDSARAMALASPSGIAIVDEFGPHLWTGKSAFQTWWADYDKDAKAKGITDPVVTMEAPLVNTIDRDVAYLVCPMTYTYKLKGVAMREPARMAMVLQKEGAVWRFTSWTWAGTVPKVAAK
jgi:hypothetical protein